MAHTPPSALEADSLSKTYPGGRRKPRVLALDGVSLATPSGTILSLLGPNGAGKSTTAKILATLSRADSGSAHIAGIDVGRHPEKVRKVIGFVAQKQVSDPMDTGMENLVLAGRLQGMPAGEAKARARDLVERFSLSEAAGRQVRTYSGGMARKLDVAIGLMHRPQVLFLDEPTTGLDPEARREMWAELEAMTHAESMTVLLTTHYLEEADRLADRVVIMDHGRVVAEGTPEGLKDDLHGDAVVVELGVDTDIEDALRRVSTVAGVRELLVDGRTIRGRAAVGATTLPQILSALDEARLAVASATVARPSLDDVYLRHTGHTLATSTGGAA